MSSTISPRARFCAVVGWKGSTSRMRGADLLVGCEGDAGALAGLAALDFEAEFQEEELFEDEAAVRGRARALELGQRTSRHPGNAPAAATYRAMGKPQPFQHGGGQRFRNAARAARREALKSCAAEPARAELGAAQGFIDGRDAAHFQASRTLQSPSGRISNCGWIILKPRDEREASTLPKTATVWPDWNRSLR